MMKSKRAILQVFLLAVVWTQITNLNLANANDYWGSEQRRGDETAPNKYGSEYGVKISDEGASAAAQPPVTDSSDSSNWGSEARRAKETAPKSCEEAAKDAQLACNTMGFEGMTPMEQIMFQQLMNQTLQAGITIASMKKDAVGQCKLQRDLNGWVGAINGIKGGACAKMQSDCQDLCKSEEDRYPNDEKKVKFAHAAARKCAAYKVDVATMMSQTVQSGLASAQASQCVNQLSALANMPAPTWTPITFATPSTDCSDPNNQSFTCYCARPANAKAPMCAGFGTPGFAGSGGVSTSGPTAGSLGSTGSTFGTSGDLGGDAGDLAGANGQQKPGAGSGGKEMGDGGSSAPGAAQLASLGGDGGGGGAPGDPKSMITGTSGGQGGLSGSGGGGGMGGSLAKFAGGLGGIMEKFDLKKFLPSPKVPTRGIAGMSVKSVDGITGPMGPSIWEKATKQYQEQIQKQNVLLDR